MNDLAAAVCILIQFVKFVAFIPEQKITQFDIKISRKAHNANVF